ncbi:hypothetical protein [Ottowia oryzae]
MAISAHWPSVGTATAAAARQPAFQSVSPVAMFQAALVAASGDGNMSRLFARPATAGRHSWLRPGSNAGGAGGTGPLKLLPLAFNLINVFGKAEMGPLNWLSET